MANRHNKSRKNKGTQARGSNRGKTPSKRANNNNKKKTARPAVHIGKCAEDYARCLANPITGPIACIPDAPALHTRRVRVFSKGTFGCSSTTGVGFLVFTPKRMAYSDGTAGYRSQSAYAGTTVGCNTATAGIDPIRSNSDYLSTAIGNGKDQVQYRIVAACVRIKYRGTELNRGGTIYALQEPTHDNLRASTISDFAGQADTVKFTVNEKWTNVLYKPVLVDDNLFSDANNLSTNDENIVNFPNAAFMGFMIQAPAVGVACEFEYEAYAVLEYTGRNVRGTQPSHYDPVGYAAVHTVASSSRSRLPSQGEVQAHEKSFLEEIGDYILGGLTWVENAAGQVLRTGLAIVGTAAALL